MIECSDVYLLIQFFICKRGWLIVLHHVDEYG